MSSPRIAVVGAGLGGLSCARRLQIHGHSVTVFERDTAPASRAQGGTLDMHAETGRVALRAAGLFDRFLELARPEGDEVRTLDTHTAAVLRHDRSAGGDQAAPEIDRGQLRGLYLAALAADTVRWGDIVDGVLPLDDGTARVLFRDGTTETFDLVVGADGAWSRVRSALSEVTPDYTGSVLVETSLDDVDTRYPALADLIGNGTLVIGAGATSIAAQRNSGGHVRVYVGFDAAADWHVAAGIDMDDTAAVRGYLLDRCAGWHDSVLDLLRVSDGGFINRPQYVLPIGFMWDRVPGITLLGDAAHLMPPLGIGANLAMLDGVDLADAVAAQDGIAGAVEDYEGVMFRRPPPKPVRTCWR